MLDVLIVGAGPAGAVAATVLARAGARVLLVDRATFPREKMCGDTINPGTLALLRRLRLADAIDCRGRPVAGMLVTGEGGVAVEGRYPDGLTGRALRRSELDSMLLEQAIGAGAGFEGGLPVRAPIVTEASGRRFVEGAVTGANGRTRSIRARVTIAADGRRSTLAFGLRLARHPIRPRRWAIGGYFEAETNASSLGEMHIRRGRYIGVATIAGGLTNICVVKPAAGGDCEFRDPEALLLRAIAEEPLLRDRFVGRRPVCAPLMLGPLAVDHDHEEIDGLIFAGDAAGFIDPMTGDGLRFAVGGGELAACAALDALQNGWSGVHKRLVANARSRFAAKRRFNRAVRALVASPPVLRAATMSARVAPSLVAPLIAYAGDCGLARNP